MKKSVPLGREAGAEHHEQAEQQEGDDDGDELVVHTRNRIPNSRPE